MTDFLFTPPRRVEPADFPASELAVPGMRTLPAVDEPRYGEVHLNVPYAEKSGRTLHLQIIMPPRRAAFPDTATDVYPTILYVQGSAFHTQQLGHELGNLVAFAARGYVIAIVEYRGSEVAPFPAQAKDAKTAVRWLRAHAAEYHVDVNRMAMWGDSSGGHTTLMTWATGTGGADDDPAFSDEPVAEALGLRAFVDYYGPTHIGRMNEYPSIQDHLEADSPEGWLIGHVRVDEHPELVAPTVIMDHVPHASRRALPPLLVVHGDKDRIVNFSQSVWLVEDLQAKGQEVTFYRLAGADHGGAPFWQDGVLDVVDTFLKEHLS
ncbi:alpha/beta hydrolase [Actinomyces procaprae]|uniref:alpha/beta hydrolase n=1 Tax=Actinomyces procaprae TaxID=2560010 RepID=UPI00195B73B0|nr:alpha/beta hydrolase [Actinomyces procaprae]